MEGISDNFIYGEEQPNSFDPCVRCGKPSPYPKELSVDYRNFYVEGSGQLCIECWKEIYNNNDKSWR